ncbi:uroporphyrinogen-III synthase [Lapillicoccus sp.]|uniref:uroporphyrinogen-III synthase n=1 Tax=Lapillicoccus sp. TaxID=1909287 RepID=UPI003983A174
MTTPAPTPHPEQVGFSADLLSGFRIGVTSDRRSEDLISALERRGATVLHAPALRIAPLDRDELLLADTQAVLAAEPDVVLVTTAYGLRRWVEAADAIGLGEALHATLSAATMLVRGPKARGAVRAAGLSDDGIAGDERTATLVDMVLAHGVAGRTVVVQLHGYADVEQLGRLERAGATVLTVAPYRWVAPSDGDRLPRLIDAICAGNLDAVTFTSAPAVDALFSGAAELGVLDQLILMLRGDVVAAAVGPVTAAPLLHVGIVPIVPDRYRLGALIRLVCEHLATQRVTRVTTALGAIEVRGRTVRLGEDVAVLAPGPLAIFRALLDRPGTVLSREQLATRLPEAENEHALDMAMSRLRAALPDPALVSTVVKRGYRLNV